MISFAGEKSNTGVNKSGSATQYNSSQNYIEDKKAKEIKLKNDAYDRAKKLMRYGKYSEAAEEFAMISGWKDSFSQFEYCQRKIEEQKLSRGVKQPEQKKSREGKQAEQQLSQITSEITKERDSQSDE